MLRHSDDGPDYLMKAVGLLFLGFMAAGAAQPIPAQLRYVPRDLGALNGSNGYPPGPVAGIYAVAGINNSGQVIGSLLTSNLESRAFRTSPNSPISPATDDLGTLGGTNSFAAAINNFGQVVGTSTGLGIHAFRTAPNSKINPLTDDLGEGSGGPVCSALGINDSAQVVGYCTLGMAHQDRGFRTGPNSVINSFTDDIGSLESSFGPFTVATGINSSGQVAGTSGSHSHAFRTSPNSPINPATDDLGTLGGSFDFSSATSINNSGQVVGGSYTTSGQFHAFRTAANSPINPATDDLGTLGGSFDFSSAASINDSGQVVGSSGTLAGQFRAFLHSGGVMYDLNSLIPSNSGWILLGTAGINDLGQIAGNGVLNGAPHAFRLDPATPASLTSFLLDTIADLPRGTSIDLSSVLRACLVALERGNDIAARNQLGAFENKVHALSGKTLTTAQADLLLNTAAMAIELL